MAIFRRLSSAVVTQFEFFVSAFENHDALATASLKEMRGSLGRGHAQLARVTKDGENLQVKIQEGELHAKRWAERAVEQAGQNKAQALECLRRKKQHEDSLRLLRMELTKHQETERTLRSDLLALEAKVEELSRKRNLLRGRATRASALEAVGSIEDSASMSSVQEALARWEDRITEQEYRSGATGSSLMDDLERNMETQEEHAQLEHELERLLGSQKQ